jgi:hypothetical protein
MHATAQLTQVGPSRGPPNYMPREPSSKTAQRSRGGDVNNQMMPQRTPCTAPPTLFFSCAACAHSPKRGWYSKLRRMAVPTQYPTLFMILCCARLIPLLFTTRVIYFHSRRGAPAGPSGTPRSLCIEYSYRAAGAGCTKRRHGTVTGSFFVLFQYRIVSAKSGQVLASRSSSPPGFSPLRDRPNHHHLWR